MGGDEGDEEGGTWHCTTTDCTNDLYECTNVLLVDPGGISVSAALVVDAMKRSNLVTESSEGMKEEEGGSKDSS